MTIQRRDEVVIVVKVNQKLFRRFHDTGQWQELNSMGWENVGWKMAELEAEYQANQY